MVKRFSGLEDVYNTLIAANFDMNTLPASNKYRKYSEWKQDPDLRKLPAGSSQDTGQRAEAGVRPFGLAFEDVNKYDVGMSGRVLTVIGELGGKSLYAIETDALSEYTKRAGFIPAKAILAKRLPSSVAVTGSNNRITGQPYKKSVGESYTVPFGMRQAADNEFETQEAILTQQGVTHAISFKPEKLYRR